MNPTRNLEIAVVLYPGAQLAAVLGLTDLFAVANQILAAKGRGAGASLKVTHWQQAIPGGPLVSLFESDAQISSHLSAVILPPSLGNNPDVHGDGDDALIDWLREQHREGAVVCSVCAGAFLLARTGLMDGRRITTHWLHTERLQQHFPSIRVDSEEMLIDEGDVMSAGGLMSWTDLGLRLVDRLLGPAIMLETARTLLVDPPGREQRYYSLFSPRMTHGDAAVLKVQHWLRDTHAQDIALSSLAARAELEERTFLRRFQKATGMTSTQYCQRIRIGRGRALLESGAMSIDAVAWEVGYHDAAAFRKVFKRILGLSPGEYRRRFAGAVGKTLSAQG